MTVAGELAYRVVCVNDLHCRSLYRQLEVAMDQDFPPEDEETS